MTDRTPLTDEELKQLTVRLAGQCVHREYCTGEIRSRLERRGLPSAQIEAVLQQLTRHRFVDDTRYAGAFVRTKLKAGWGKWKITHALRVKQIPTQLISKALTDNTDRDDYLSAAMKAARSKAGRLDLSLRTDCARLYRFLASRGYESDVISKVVNRLRTEL